MNIKSHYSEWWKSSGDSEMPTDAKFKMELQEIIGKYYPNMNIDVVMKLIKEEYPEEFI